MSFIHPRNLDAGQPMQEGLLAARKFKSYVALKGAENKLRKCLTEFAFTDIDTAAGQIDWGDGAGGEGVGTQIFFRLAAK